MNNILKKENRIVLIVAIFCLIFIGVIVNYTYSFFAVEKTNSSIIAGEAESMKLDLTVVEKSSTNNGKLIPQLDEYITSAVIGRNGSCIDDNNNTVCQVYKITLKNSGSSSVYVNGEVVIDNKDNPNLKWAILNNTDTDVLTAPVLSGNIKTPAETVLTSNELFTAGQTKNYFIVVWISEKGQTQIDSGKFTGIVNFNNSEGNESSLALETLTSLGLEDEVRTNELNFAEGSYAGTYEEIKSSIEDECINVLGYDTLDECIQDIYGFDTFDDYYAKYYPTTDDTGIYEAEDDIGTSYYFRGNVTNNYVKFGKYTEDAWQVYNTSTKERTYASTCTSGGNIECTQIAEANDDMYWRIVRINGDGTIRMVYAGTSAHDNGVARESIGNSAYNINYNDNAYVGYMYGATGQSTYADTHANTNNSTIKTTIDNWYSKYLNANYSQYIADAIYCNDRKVVTDDSKYKAWWEDDTKVAGNGIGISDTMY